MSIEKHYVTFSSPGTMFSESTRKPISKWDTKDAVQRAQYITERHGAKPYCFYFETLLEHDPIPDGQGGMLEVKPKTIKASGRYFIEGRIITYDEVKRNEEGSILARNMRCNDWPFVCETNNGYKHTLYFDVKDVVVDFNGKIIERGDSEENMKYRKKFKKVTDEYFASLTQKRTL